jgi:hypothetical protein
MEGSISIGYGQNLYHEAGIKLQHTVPYTPQHNGVVEKEEQISQGDD